MNKIRSTKIIPAISRTIKEFIQLPLWNKLFLFLIGASITISVYLGLFQRHTISKRFVLYALLIGIAGSSFIQIFIIPVFKKLDTQRRIFSILSALVFTGILFVNITVPPVYNLIPEADLNVHIPIPAHSTGSEPLRLLWVKNRQGYIHFSNLEIDGDWKQDGKHLLFSGEQDVNIHWRGAVGPYTEIAFRKPVRDQEIVVEWGREKPVSFSLSSADSSVEYAKQLDGTTNVIIPLHTPVAFAFYLPFILTFIFAGGFAILSIMLLLVNMPLIKKKQEYKNRHWLLYALPMILIWTFILMVFWPGILTNDGLGQWTQVETGNYNDWQSTIYSLLIWVLTRLWYSPAIVGLLQIFSLALVVAYGLHIFEKRGIHPIVLWILSILMAVLPVNMIYQSIIWKDIPYAITFLWLTILLTAIYFSDGNWIKNWKHILALGICAAGVALFRKNGIAVAAGTLVVLTILYFKNWKRFSLTAVIAVVLYAGITGPLFSAITIEEDHLSQSNLIYLHHIAAHIDAGTPLTEEEDAYLRAFLPLDEWDYWCYYVGPISYNPDFERDAFLASGDQNLPLAWNLFLRDPVIDIKHTLCASELVWRVTNSHQYMKSTHGFNNWAPGNEGWVNKNDFGIKQASVFPTLVRPIVFWLRLFGFGDDFLVWFLRPALFLYLALFSTTIAFLRTGKWKIWVVDMPIIVQSAVLFLISFAPAYRYQYGTILAGLFMLGLLFLPDKEQLAPGN